MLKQIIYDKFDIIWKRSAQSLMLSCTAWPSGSPVMLSRKNLPSSIIFNYLQYLTPFLDSLLTNRSRMDTYFTKSLAKHERTEMDNLPIRCVLF